MKFAKKAIADQYLIVGETDSKVRLPEGYSGPISKIPKIALVRAMVARGSNLVAPVQQTPPAGEEESQTTE